MPLSVIRLTHVVQLILALNLVSFGKSAANFSCGLQKVKIQHEDLLKWWISLTMRKKIQTGCFCNKIWVDVCNSVWQCGASENNLPPDGTNKLQMLYGKRICPSSTLGVCLLSEFPVLVRFISDLVCASLTKTQISTMTNNFYYFTPWGHGDLFYQTSTALEC